MTGTLLDTSAYSQLMRGDAGARQAVREAGSVCMSVIVLGELRAGFRKGSRPAENEARLQRFLAEPRVRLLPVDEETAERYGFLYNDLARRGRPVSLNDVWIAATAFQHGLRLLTADKDFQRIPQILVDYVRPMEP